MKEYKPGVTAPPFHHWCRSCTGPYFDDEFSVGERIARDAERNNYYVPSDMTYKEWEKEHITYDAEERRIHKQGKQMENNSLVHSVGRIDYNIYKCVMKDFVTDEVIITEERIRHIKERHPNDYERYYEYLKNIVEAPDYIIEANKPHSALILKEIAEAEEKRFKTVLRLITHEDDSSFKNSIITFMKIDEKEWERLLRNKKILYKRK